ncbi:hypothetical protein SeMB42_g04971 [Synchytrium endobioticum]|uniref:Uncharacterized protein n=1 Tax=Synchytrium endobioticum TaxID=286115 RepID=A0A507D562_9FUNG|nr:hypothetical protein SeMB42_g04971 [Synchytrium endobioticum]TPX46437.1 hypothetical protein SeLEV6574_g03239 [Synchytrium endobioticum]
MHLATRRDAPPTTTTTTTAHRPITFAAAAPTVPVLLAQALRPMQPAQHAPVEGPHHSSPSPPPDATGCTATLDLSAFRDLVARLWQKGLELQPRVNGAWRAGISDWRVSGADGTVVLDEHGSKQATDEALKRRASVPSQGWGRPALEEDAPETVPGRYKRRRLLLMRARAALAPVSCAPLPLPKLPPLIIRPPPPLMPTVAPITEASQIPDMLDDFFPSTATSERRRSSMPILNSNTPVPLLSASTPVSASGFPNTSQSMPGPGEENNSSVDTLSTAEQRAIEALFEL